MISFEDIFEDYIEKIILKSRQKSKTTKYEIYVDVPLKDLTNGTLMEDIFEEYKKTFETFMLFHNFSLTEKVSKIKISMFRYKDKYSYRFLSETMSISGSFHAGKKFNEDGYRKLIKKIGSYYEWKDEEENLSENMKKKQTSLFSLLYKDM
jgi:hypothetical protein